MSGPLNKTQAGKFLLLALSAYGNKQYEEAAALFSQAAECSDVTQLTNALGEPVGHDAAVTDGPPLNDIQQLSCDEDDADEEELDEEDDGEVADDTSISTSSGVVRRKTRGLRQINAILAASMEATASEDEQGGDTVGDAFEVDADDEDAVIEPDHDIPGEALIPASFSSAVKLKDEEPAASESADTPVVASAIRLKDDE